MINKYSNVIIVLLRYIMGFNNFRLLIFLLLYYWRIHLVVGSEIFSLLTAVRTSYASQYLLFYIMFYCGLKKGTILYRKYDGGCIEISEIDYRISKGLFTCYYYKLIPIIGEWKYCYFNLMDSSKFTRNWDYVVNAMCREMGYYPIGTDFDKVVKAEIIYNV